MYYSDKPSKERLAILLTKLDGYIKLHYDPQAPEKTTKDSKIQFPGGSAWSYGGGVFHGRNDLGGFLQDLLTNKLNELAKDTFSEVLIRLAREKGVPPADLYHRAGLTRAHFSKMRNNKDYQPSKETALVLALALRLSLPEAEQLLSSAGYTLSKSKILDVIVRFCLEEKIYNVDEINCLLYEHNLPLLFKPRQMKEED